MQHLEGKKRIFSSRPAAVNRVILFLTLSDVFSWTSFTIINALIGLYLAQRFDGDAAKMIGIGIALNMLTRGIFEIPVGYFTDKIKRDRDEILILTLGCLFMGLTYVLMPFITNPNAYFALQVMFGFGTALNLNTWRKLFGKNVDKNQEGTQYGVYDTVISLIAAAISFVSGYLSGIDQQLFSYVIFVLGIIISFGGVMALGIFTVDRRKSDTIQ